MDSLFYSAFEARFRGTSELIKDRLKIYKNILLKSDGAVLDLGCGRGEWLSLLRQWGINATGIDSDPEMIRICRDQNLKVIMDDIFVSLDRYEDNSIGVISAFHVIEHLPFKMVIQLLTGCKRILKAGGFIILETPNSENIIVGSSDFYLDPTHLRPLPAKLLNFAAEYYGFQDCTVLRINSDIELPSLNLNIYNAFAGVGPDYVLIAISGENSAVSLALSEMQSTHKGYTFDISCSEYEKSFSNKLNSLLDLAYQSGKESIQQIDDLRNSLSSDLKNSSDLLQQQIIESNLNNNQQIDGLRNSLSSDLKNSSDLLQQQIIESNLNNNQQIDGLRNSLSSDLKNSSDLLQQQIIESNLNNNQQIDDLRNSLSSDLKNSSDLLQQQIIESNLNNNQQIDDLRNSLSSDLKNSSDLLQQQIIESNLNNNQQMYTLWLHCVENSREISYLKNSFSWKLTLPLRLFAKLIRKTRHLFIFRNISRHLVFLFPKKDKKVASSASVNQLNTLLYRDAENLWDSINHKLKK